MCIRDRGGLGDLADLARRRVLPLGQAVDTVVEQQDLQIHIPAQRVDQMVPADRQRVAVAGHHPDAEVAPGGGQPGGDRRGPAVDRVHSIGVHVVRETGGAADTGDEDGVLPSDPQLRHEGLYRGQDRVVTAAGAPADLLVGLELLGALRRLGLRDQLQGGELLAHRLSSSSRFPIAAHSTSANCAALKGSPRTWL